MTTELRGKIIKHSFFKKSRFFKQIHTPTRRVAGFRLILRVAILSCRCWVTRFPSRSKQKYCSCWISHEKMWRHIAWKKVTVIKYAANSRAENTWWRDMTRDFFPPNHVTPFTPRRLKKPCAISRKNRRGYYIKDLLNGSEACAKTALSTTTTTKLSTLLYHGISFPHPKRHFPRWLLKVISKRERERVVKVGLLRPRPSLPHFCWPFRLSEAGIRFQYPVLKF